MGQRNVFMTHPIRLLSEFVVLPLAKVERKVGFAAMKPTRGSHLQNCLPPPNMNLFSSTTFKGYGFPSLSAFRDKKIITTT